MPGVHASASNTLATFAEPPSPVQYRSVTSPVAHETSSVSSSCRTSNAGAGMGGKSYVAAWKKEEESESVSNGDDGMAAAVRFLLVDCSSTKIEKEYQVLYINHFHVSLAHAHSSVLKATAQQYGIQLVGELAPCSGCLMAKGIRAPTPHRTTSRAAAPLDLVHIDTTRPFPESLGGSRYVAMFVDSAFPLSAPLRDTGQKRIGHPRSGAAIRCRHGSHGHSGRITALSTPTRRSWSTVTVSKSAAS